MIDYEYDYDYEDMSQMYTFYDYVFDRKLLSDMEGYMFHALVLWDLYRKDYLAYYKENDYDYEIL